MKKSVKKMTNEELLREYSCFERWVGNDFSLYPIEESDVRRARRVEKEIILRMDR